MQSSSRGRFCRMLGDGLGQLLCMLAYVSGCVCTCVYHLLCLRHYLDQTAEGRGKETPAFSPPPPSLSSSSSPTLSFSVSFFSFSQSESLCLPSVSHFTSHEVILVNRCAALQRLPFFVFNLFNSCNTVKESNMQKKHETSIYCAAVNSRKTDYDLSDAPAVGFGNCASLQMSVFV